MVESWSEENGPSAGSALVHKERAKVWDGGPSKPWCPAGCKVLEFSRVWNGCTTGFLLTQEKKKKKQPGRNIFCLWRWRGRWMEKSNC